MAEEPVVEEIYEVAEISSIRFPNFRYECILKDDSAIEKITKTSTGISYTTRGGLLLQ